MNGSPESLIKRRSPAPPANRRTGIYGGGRPSGGGPRNSENTHITLASAEPNSTRFFAAMRPGIGYTGCSPNRPLRVYRAGHLPGQWVRSTKRLTECSRAGYCGTLNIATAHPGASTKTARPTKARDARRFSCASLSVPSRGDGLLACCNRSGCPTIGDRLSLAGAAA
jgi:hypothetical protein